jgi:hypothetical protein
MPVTPFKEFSPPVAVPHHCGRCPLVVTTRPRPHRRGNLDRDRLGRCSDPPKWTPTSSVLSSARGLPSYGTRCRVVRIQSALRRSSQLQGFAPLSECFATILRCQRGSPVPSMGFVPLRGSYTARSRRPEGRATGRSRAGNRKSPRVVTRIAAEIPRLVSQTAIAAEAAMMADDPGSLRRIRPRAFSARRQSPDPRSSVPAAARRLRWRPAEQVHPSLSEWCRCEVACPRCVP